MNTNITHIYLATDHAGYELKEKVKSYLSGKGFDVIDCGDVVYNQIDDYTDYIHAAAQKLQSDIHNDIDSRAIVFGGSGEGEAIVMNRYAGVRCTTYYGTNLDIIKLGREHNDANALSFGARFVEDAECIRAVDMFLETLFSEEERHIRRIEKIDIKK
jgi:ribose 5-phosphate isomerase B